MNSTEKERILAFLQSKMEATAGLMPTNSSDSFKKWWQPVLNSLGRPTISELKSLDRELNMIIRSVGGREAATLVEEHLGKVHGYRSIESTPEGVAKCVLKRGFIRNLNEATIIRDFLAEDSNCAGLENKQATVLGSILFEFETKQGS